MKNLIQFNLIQYKKLNQSFKIGFFLFGFFLFIGLISLFWTPHSYKEIYEGKSLLGSSSEFFLGTDDLGRDLFSRLLVGSQLSLVIGLFVGLVSVIVGASLGLIAGFFSGRTDYWLTLMMNAIQSMPSLLLALFVIAILGPGIFNTILSVTLVSIPIMYRLVRSAAQIESSKDYIQSAIALGANPARIITKHMLPNCLTPILVQSAVCCSEAILNTAALCFLGLGIPAPFPEWGTMLSDARNLMDSAPRLMIAPGLALLLLILSFQLMSDGLRDQLDPKLRG